VVQTGSVEIGGQAVREGAPLLEVRDLVAAFPGRGGLVLAANHVSFDISHGETLGLVGESGSGKSVTCRSILKMVPSPGTILGGSIVFESTDLLTLPTRSLRDIRGRDIGMIFQDPMTSLNPVLTVGDQLREPLRIHRRLGRREAEAEALNLLERVGISDARHRLRVYPHELSGGMRQRVMIAIAISCRPRLLIADEPTTALDVTIQDQILALLLELQKEEQMAILLVSHDLGVVAETCDRVAVMYAGYIVEAAAAQPLLETPLHPYTRGLLRALPTLGGDRRGDRLVPIAGQPPDLGRLPEGCPFAPRCTLVREDCTAVPMRLIEVQPGRRTACPFGCL
jgi:oligopeptide/dipeptide ABC transporter ATP-binding protein